MARHNDTGNWGEDIACEILRSKGYTVMERNWRSGHYEIDIIAARDGAMVFAEVKTRTGYDIDPLDAIDSRKIARLSSAAHAYIVAHDVKQDVRFDVFGISGTPDDYTAEHIEDAFLPPLKTIS